MKKSKKRFKLISMNSVLENMSNLFQKILEGNIKDTNAKKVDFTLIFLTFVVLFLVLFCYDNKYRDIEVNSEKIIVDAIVNTLSDEKNYAQDILNDFYYEDLYYCTSEEEYAKINRNDLTEYLGKYINIYNGYDNIFLVNRNNLVISSDGRKMLDETTIEKYDTNLKNFFDGNDEFLYLYNGNKNYASLQIFRRYRNVNGDTICLVGIEIDYQKTFAILEKFRKIVFPKELIIKDPTGRIFYTSCGYSREIEDEENKFNKDLEKIREYSKNNDIRKISNGRLKNYIDNPLLYKVVSLYDNEKMYIYQRSRWFVGLEHEIKIGIVERKNGLHAILNNMYYGNISFVLVALVCSYLLIGYLFEDNKKKMFKIIFITMQILMVLVAIVIHKYIEEYSYVKNVKNVLSISTLLESTLLHAESNDKLSNFAYENERTLLAETPIPGDAASIEPMPLIKNIFKGKKSIIDYSLRGGWNLNDILEYNDILTVDDNNILYKRCYKQYVFINGAKMEVIINSKANLINVLEKSINMFNNIPSNYRSYRRYYNNELKDKLKNELKNELLNMEIDVDLDDEQLEQNNDIEVDTNENETHRSLFRKYSCIQRPMLEDLELYNKEQVIKKVDGKYTALKRKKESDINYAINFYQVGNVTIYVNGDKKSCKVHIYYNTDPEYIAKEARFTYNFVDYSRGIEHKDLEVITILLFYYVVLAFIYKKFVSVSKEEFNDEDTELINPFEEMFKESSMQKGDLSELKKKSDEIQSRRERELKDEDLSEEIDEKETISEITNMAKITKLVKKEINELQGNTNSGNTEELKELDRLANLNRESSQKIGFNNDSKQDGVVFDDNGNPITKPHQSIEPEYDEKSLANSKEYEEFEKELMKNMPKEDNSDDKDE